MFKHQATLGTTNVTINETSCNFANSAAPVGAAMHMPFALLGLGYLVG
jgi:hypothetical protein